MKLNIGITDQNRQAVVDLLNTVLADEYALYTKTRNYHWNVTGPQFNDLHKFFQTQYEALDEFVDEVAERARTLGGRAAGSLSEFAKATRLTEDTGGSPGATEMIKALLTDHETLVRALRQDVASTAERHQDMGTSDFLTGLMEKHEKMAWMLRAFLG